MRPASFVEFGSIALDPAINGGMIDVEPPLQHHLLQVAVAERGAQVPPHAQEDDVSFARDAT
jgi:hypothetical protein